MHLHNSVSNLNFSSRLDTTHSESFHIQKSNCFPLSTAIGIIALLGGMFLLLACHQILPHGINAMSEMGIWGQVIGYGMIGSGFLTLLIGGVKKYAHRTNELSHTHPSREIQNAKGENTSSLSEQQEQRTRAAASIQNAFRGYQVRQKLRRDKAAITLQKHWRGYLARKQVNEIKAREQAAITLQSLIRMHAAQKKMEQEKRHVLSYSLFEGAKKYTEDSTKLMNVPHAPQGKNRNKIYMPQELPIVIRVCKDEEDSKRFLKMTQARAICSEKNKFQHVIVPKARMQGNFIIEERLPSENGSTVKGMVFYFENREFYTEAVKEFTSFLCYGYLGDIVGGNRNALNYLNVGQVPRFDNLLLYAIECVDKKLYKIGVIDLETFDLNSSKPRYGDVSYALSMSVQLFPYHFDAIIEVGKTFYEIASKDVEELQEEACKSKQLYQIVCENNLSLYKKQNINLQNQVLFTIKSERKEELKKQMGAFVLKINKEDLRGYFGVLDCLKDNPESTAYRFQEEICPKMIDLIENTFRKLLPSGHSFQPSSYGELIERRMILEGMTSGLERQFMKAEKKSDSSPLKEIFKESPSPPFLAIFEELLNQLVKGGELSYYKIHVSGTADVIFL